VNAERENAEALKAQADREAAQAIGRGATRVARGVSGALDEAGDRANAIVDALFRDRVDSRPPPNGPVDYQTVDARRAVTEADIRNNLQGAAISGYPEAAYGAWPGAAALWVARVWPRGAWDDKHVHAINGRDDPRYERQGNFSYGATAEALGLPRSVAQFGAGMAQRGGAVMDAVKGIPIRARAGAISPPYGDDPRDQPAIIEGYDYGRNRRRR
jgi:hypothetical protein